VKHKSIVTTVLAAVLVSPASVAPAQQAAPPPLPGYTLPATQMWDLTSDHKQVYRILVSYPSGQPPAGGWPVLYVLDGNAIFASFAETRRLQEYSDVGKSIVVGVGYPTDKTYDTRRLYDLTSSAPPPEPWRTEFAKLPSGGRDRFLDFLTGRLRTEIGRRFKIDPARQALFGHSLGGLFALHALYSRPDAFHAIVSASPTLFWHEQEMLQQERGFADRLKAGRVPRVSRLLLLVGERDETALERWDGEDLAVRLRPLSQYGLRTRSETYAGEGHMTVPVRAVADTLRFVFTWP
jgi:predicted alpha/beta superfamily hydrolase